MPVTHGFPPGYFTIRSRATDRVLDVRGNVADDGAEVILYAEMEKSLVEGLRQPEADNQVFFIDTSGSLCSRASGHAIDVEEGHLVLRHRRPITEPYPNTYSHPLPTFEFAPKSGEITVHFEFNPAYPPVTDSPNESWRRMSYILSSIPVRRPRTFVDDASAFLSSAMSNSLSYFSGASPQSRPQDVLDAHLDLDESEILEQDRGEENEVDDSPDPLRPVRVLAVSAEKDGDIEERALERRRWEVVPLRRTASFTGTMDGGGYVRV